MVGGGRMGQEVYRYEAPWTVFSMNWSRRPDRGIRLALGSFIEDYDNKVQVVTLDEETSEFTATSTFDHKYPTTKVMWIPDKRGTYPDLLATSGDYLRVWLPGVGREEPRLECILDNSKASTYCAPITSFDWNEVDPNMLGTASIDTTCTVWGLETGQVLGRTMAVTGHVRTQLVAHEKEVYDIAFSRLADGKSIFATVGGDGSLRVFDLRNLEQSTIIYDVPGSGGPLLRLDWNKQDPNYVATVADGAAEVLVLDVRYPRTPTARLSAEGQERRPAAITGLAWAPHSSGHIATAGEDHQALIWDIQRSHSSGGNSQPILAYSAQGGELNQIRWGAANPDWIGICYDRSLEILHV
jgi:WD repeat-containing protein 68